MASPTLAGMNQQRRSCGLAGEHTSKEVLAEERERRARAEEIGGATDRCAGVEEHFTGLRAQLALLRDRRDLRGLAHVRGVAVHIEAVERDQTSARARATLRR